MLDISNSIAKGKNRALYIHPLDANLCLKVQYIDNKENKIDKAYYSHLKRRKISFNHIAEFRGEVNTNLGKALMFDLIRDFDGNISKTLEYYLDAYNQHITEEIFLQMRDLKKYLLKYRVVFVDVSPENIVLQKISESEFRLVIVDALGSRNFIPFSHYVPYLARKMIYRRWNRSMKSRYSQYKKAIT